jgi:DNA-3-methyladenine glycosylase II
VTPHDVADALARADPRLAPVIAAVGPPALGASGDETATALVRSVVYQQLSGKAASTIHGRVLGAFGDGERPDLAALAGAADEALRACGLSRAKALAVRDVAERALDGRLPDRAHLTTLTDDEVERALVAVRGVGPWTAQMLMMFTLGRPDVWPVADLGVREGYRLISGATARPTAAELAVEGERYRPFRSAAAWYLWRAVDLERARLAAPGAPPG